MDFVLYFGSL